MFEDTIGGTHMNMGNKDTADTGDLGDGQSENYQDVIKAALDFKANAILFIEDKNQ